MHRMRHAECCHRVLHRADDRARRDAPFRHRVIEPEAPRVLLEGRRSARIDYLHAQRPCRPEHPSGIIRDRCVACIAAQQFEQKILVAEHHQDRLVDPGDRRQFELRLHRDVRRDRRLDDGGEAHPRIEPADLVRDGGSVEMPARALIRQQQPRGVDVEAGDVAVDVDAARHHDRSRGIVARIRGAILGCDDPAVLEPQIGGLVAAVRRIDHPPAGEQRQHGSAARMRPSASAAEGASPAAAVSRATSVPSAGSNSTAS